MYNTDKISVKSNSKINNIKAKENCEGKSNSSHSIQNDRAGGKWLKTKKRKLIYRTNGDAHVVTMIVGLKVNNCVCTIDQVEVYR